MFVGLRYANPTYWFALPSHIRDNHPSMPPESKQVFRHDQDPLIPTVLVLGGSGVIGSAVCLRFAKNGWNVGVHYHTRHDSADAIVHKIENPDQKSRSFQADVSDGRQIHTLFNQVQTVWPELDAIVWAAGTTTNRLTVRITPAEWERMLHVNLTGLFLCLQQGLRFFSKKRGGAVTVVNSLSSTMGGTGQAAYAACKAGALGLVKSAAKELGKANVRVNAVFPGWHQSPLAGDAFPGPDQLHAHVLGRTPSLDEVADLIYRLTTSRDISGQAYNLDNRIR
ncbi:MAG: SDR family oxidoreductase [Nitrospira sp. SB0677_bin_15]|nr:SDR family oxidoreductase [Nitrospira sp. SB0677_bin_15]